jgi:hypothetical protein
MAAPANYIRNLNPELPKRAARVRRAASRFARAPWRTASTGKGISGLQRVAPLV